VKISKERLGDVLSRASLGEILHTEKGYKICCPFHQDTNPSAIVFYGSGVFYCLAGCGKKSLPQLLNKLGIKIDLAELADLGPELGKQIITPLLPGESAKQETKPETLGVITEDPWPWEKFGYRAIRPENMVSGYIHKLFQPTLVRLWLGKNGKNRQEHYQRLCLHYAKHAVYARLSSEQEVKYYNSPHLSPSDPKLHPFGLESFKLPKNVAGLILTEGPYDVLRTIQNLEDLGIREMFPVIGLLGVSHWGSFFKKLKLHLVQQFDSPILFAFDNDKAGRDLTNLAMLQCSKELLLPDDRLIAFPFDAQDLGGCDGEMIKKGLLQVGY